MKSNDEDLIIAGVAAQAAKNVGKSKPTIHKLIRPGFEEIHHDGSGPIVRLLVTNGWVFCIDMRQVAVISWNPLPATIIITMHAAQPVAIETTNFDLYERLTQLWALYSAGGKGTEKEKGQ